jgi:hypothetical protein
MNVKDYVNKLKPDMLHVRFIVGYLIIYDILV